VYALAQAFLSQLLILTLYVRRKGMRLFRHFTLLTAVLTLTGLFTLSCGGGSSPVTREVADVTPIVVLTVENGGLNGADLGGLIDGSPAPGGLVISWPVNLKAQVFLPAGTTLGDDTPVVGDLITHVGKVHFESSTDGGETWVSFQHDVQISGNGYASYNNFSGLDGCPDLLLLRAHFVPSTTNGGPKKGNGTALTEAGSDTYQQFSMGTISSPFVAAWIEVEQDIDGTRDGVPVQYPLSLGPGAPASIEGTRALHDESGTPQTFPISFTLYVTLRGVHNYTLQGKSHVGTTGIVIGDGDVEILDPGALLLGYDFSIPMNVSTCDEEGTTFSHTFTGISPIGNGPLISHLFLEGTLWELGDPHAAQKPTQPAPTEPTP
jgi:hypothetical protein